LGLCRGGRTPPKFCLKPMLFTGACATGKHELQKFQLHADSYYIRMSESSAFCAPVLDTEWQTSPVKHTRMME